MRIGVLGTGEVGRTLATGLIAAGHEARLGSRSASHGASATWATETGAGASSGDFADAAAFGEVVINATGGGVSLAALALAGEAQLAGKVLIDVSNALRQDGTGPLPLIVANTDSVAEQIQRAHPAARVVKTLNTMNNNVMVAPELVPGEHVVFVCGDDDAAKKTVAGLLRDLGWGPPQILDLGGIEAARGTEAFMLLWLPIWQAVANVPFNIAVHRASSAA
jgi:predicted dinucleotide-binding enzyme